MMTEKIELPDYCCPFTGVGFGSDNPNCKHDWERFNESDTHVTFHCVKCGYRREYEVYE